MSFKKGYTPWNKGIKQTYQNGMLGKSSWNKGKKMSPETIEKNRLAQLGSKHSLETKLKMREHGQKSEKNVNWKGTEVGYRALHYWIERQLGKPTKCEHCSKDNLYSKAIHWANKSGEYRRDITDWIRLCVSCHAKYDVSLKQKITS